MQNTEYKCPYCLGTTSAKGVEFDNWISVRKHGAKCKLSTHEYMVCEYYGPIKISTLNSYVSVQAFKKDYPLTTFHSNQWITLRKRNKNVSINRFYSKEDCIKMIQNFYKEHGRIPVSCEFENTIPTRKTFANIFGTWNAAIEAAGFTPNVDNGFSIKTVANDGITYDSAVESYFVNNFLFGKFQYEYYKPYGNGSYFDFYLPKLDLYIEIDGGFSDEVKNYRTKMNQKIQFCKNNDLKLLVIPFREIYKKDFKIQ